MSHEHHAYWTSLHTWTDPNCYECAGEGAPCCEPPDGRPPTYEELCEHANTLLDATLRHGVPGGDVYNAWWALRYLLEGKTPTGETKPHSMHRDGDRMCDCPWPNHDEATR